jgi:pilus assembly protein CpaC
MNAGKSFRVSLATALSAAVAIAPTHAFAQVEPADAPALRITNGGGGGARSASLVLPYGKSAIIDLPADARDVLISNPEIADATIRTARRAYVIGRQLGQTNLFFFDAAGRQIANVEIRVEPDVDPLNGILRRHSSESQIQAEAVNGSVVLSGTARSAADADRARLIATQFLATSGGGGAAGTENRIVNLIQVQGSEQVLVRVRVATRNGFSINGAILGGLSATGGVAENILRPNSLAYPNGVVNPNIGPGDAGVGGYQYDTNGTIDPLDDMETFGPAHVESSRRTDATIEAFERAGLLRVLAEPNLTAISGEAARFLAGGEFPVPVSSEDGQISVEFKPFGVGLAFTPVVMSGGRISLKVATEVSELTSEGAISTGDTPIRNADGTTTVIRGITIPALQVRRAETTLEMSSGSSIVMAGLIQERTRHAMEGVPGVMNTPVIGALFRSRDFVNNETELVVIVTPYLVRPTAPENLRTPADGFRNPSDSESYLMGRLNSLYRAPRDRGEGDQDMSLQGPHGHVIE